MMRNSKRYGKYDSNRRLRRNCGVIAISTKYERGAVRWDGLCIWEKRNMLMHNSLEPFESVHVVAYSLAQVFIYIMIMKKAGICDQMIIQAIDKVL